MAGRRYGRIGQHGFPLQALWTMLWLALVASGLWCTGAARAAEFEVRDDLAPHLARLVPLYRPFYAEELLRRPGDHPEEAADAATPTQEWDGLPHHIIRISGPIEKGDLARLDAFVEAQNPPEGWFTWSLVLDSPGGNFQEGIAIGKWLRERLSSQDPNFLGSFVLRDTECLSACALIFALSSHKRMLDDTDSSNYLELGGRLGFHMGVLPDAVAATKIPIRDTMNLTYDIMAAYMVLIEDQTSPPDLIIEALKARDAQSFFYVEASARAYDLGFIPVSDGNLSRPLSTAALSMETVDSLCIHLREISQLPQTIVNEEYGFLHAADVEFADDLFDGQETEVFRGNFVSGESCLIGRSTKGNLLIHVTNSNFRCKAGDDPYANWCAVDQDENVESQVQSSATNALLADISACPMGRLHPLVNRAGLETDIYAFPENFGLAQIARNVNLRAQPALTAPQLAKLATGDMVHLRDCAVTEDNQAVWLKVQAGEMLGWISARFAHVYNAEWVGIDEQP